MLKTILRIKKMNFESFVLAEILKHTIVCLLMVVLSFQTCYRQAYSKEVRRGNQKYSGITPYLDS